LQGIAQSRPSSFPISSQLLFGFLDDASEKTWLCGTTESVKKYVFDGDAGKICLELKNLVACTGFLIEQKLVSVLNFKVCSYNTPLPFFFMQRAF